MNAPRYAVVGGGIVGLATAREMARRHPGATVTVLEKEPSVGRHQTSHNSGVVHAGVYYPAGSLKARLCARGRALLERFCADEGLPYTECGKVVVARHAGELERLAVIEARARANGVPGLRRLDPAALAEVEPHAAGIAGLHSPHTAITDYSLIAQRMAAALEVLTGFEVAAFRDRTTEVVLAAADGREVGADLVVICGGLGSDLLAGRAAGRGNGAALSGEGPDGERFPLIVAFRGEYWRLSPAKSHLVRGLIYPVPDPRYPFLGVHFTRRVGGEVELGPNAVLALAREGYRRRDVDPAWLGRLMLDRRFRAMARSNWRAGAYELAGSLSKRMFVRRAATLLPGLAPGDVVPAPAGVRAQAVGGDGSLVDDFRISRVGPDGRVIAVLNAPSPAATSCLAIAEHICDLLPT